MSRITDTSAMFAMLYYVTIQDHRKVFTKCATRIVVSEGSAFIYNRGSSLIHNKLAEYPLSPAALGIRLASSAATCVAGQMVEQSLASWHLQSLSWIWKPLNAGATQYAKTYMIGYCRQDYDPEWHSPECAAAKVLFQISDPLHSSAMCAALSTLGAALLYNGTGRSFAYYFVNGIAYLDRIQAAKGIGVGLLAEGINAGIKELSYDLVLAGWSTEAVAPDNASAVAVESVVHSIDTTLLEAVGDVDKDADEF